MIAVSYGSVIHFIEGPPRFHALCPSVNLFENSLVKIQFFSCVCVCGTVFGVPTSQFEFHSAVVNERPVNLVAEGFKGSDAEHSWLLLPQILVGSPPERVLSKDTAGDWKGQTVEIKECIKKVLLFVTKSPGFLYSGEIIGDF